MTPITDPMHEIFDPYRPDPKIMDSYIRRTLPGGYDDIEYFLTLWNMGRETGVIPNIALVGDTQAGKTMLMRALAVEDAKRQGLDKPWPLFTLNGSAGISNYELFGSPAPFIDADGQEKLVRIDGIVEMALRTGAILYLDEWNAVPASVGTAVHPVLDDRRQFVNYRNPIATEAGTFVPEVVSAHPDTRIVMTINNGYKGTSQMSEAGTNRWVWVPWEYDEDVERQMVPSDTVRLAGHALRNLVSTGAVRTPVGSSALRNMAMMAGMFGGENAVWAFQSMFLNERDRDHVMALLEGEGIEDALTSEYPNPVARRENA